MILQNFKLSFYCVVINNYNNTSQQQINNRKH